MANRPRTRSTTLSDRLSDRLSELPWSIIQDILGRLPIRDAVRTCVLSSQWRYTWTTIPCLLFNSTAKLERFDDTTKKFINNVLLRHEGPINRFKLVYCCRGSGSNSFDKWVLCLSRKDVKELSIQMHLNCCRGLLKSSLYKCTKLTKLELISFVLSAPPPSFRGFLNLKSIVLQFVTLSSHGFETLVCHCPVLERLSVLCCSIEEFRIRSSNLKHLQIRSRQYKKFSVHAPLLDQMDVVLTVRYDPFNVQSTDCNYTNFLGSSTNLLELSGVSFTQYLSVGIESYHATSVFHQLKVIDLQRVDFTNIAEISVLARLIADAPNVHKLKLHARLLPADEPPDVSFSDYFGFAPDFTLKKLKEVCLTFVCYYPTGMQLIKFLLESSPVLQTMELKLECQSRLDKVSAQVLGFNRASQNAKITILDSRDG